MEGRERGMPSNMEASLSMEKQFEIAEKLFNLSENVGKIVDKLTALIDIDKLRSDPELYKSCLYFRRTIFQGACDALKLSDDARTWAIESEVQSDESGKNN
jgi:hypothetical protein